MGCSVTLPANLDSNVMKTECYHDSFAERVIVLPNGAKRNIMNWQPIGHVKGIVLIAHGLHEHGMLFDKVAHGLTEKGLSCFAMDHYAHGLSDGQKGLITDWRILTNDFVCFADYIRSKRENRKLPVFIFCHSLGTLITCSSLRRMEHITAVVFVGTALFPGFASASPFGIKSLYPLTQTSIIKAAASVLGTIDPKGAASPILPDEICFNKEFSKVRNIDERCYLGQVMNKTALEVLKLIKNAKKEIPNIRTPMLVIHGADDEITLPSSSVYLHNRCGTDTGKKSLVIIKNCKHHPDFENDEISNEFIEQVGMYFESFVMDALHLPEIDLKVDEESNLDFYINSFAE